MEIFICNANTVPVAVGGSLKDCYHQVKGRYAEQINLPAYSTVSQSMREMGFYQKGVMDKEGAIFTLTFSIIKAPFITK